MRGRYRLWIMNILKRQHRRVAGPLASASGLAAGRAAAVGSEDGHGRLLLVEDNFVNRRVAIYMLNKLRYQVDVAMQGREAIDKLSMYHYDLVLMDCQMPEMDGFEATRIIRDSASPVLNHEVPVIAMTAHTFPEDRANALAVGMNDFLAKPVDRSTLQSMLEKWMNVARENESRATAEQPQNKRRISAE
jgi:CheY-like chemotaxis protein